MKLREGERGADRERQHVQGLVDARARPFLNLDFCLFSVVPLYYSIVHSREVAFLLGRAGDSVAPGAN